MFIALRSWWKKKERQPTRAYRFQARRTYLLGLERLEDRTLLSSDTLATATALPITPANNAQTGAFLSSASQVDIYSVPLTTGDVLNTGVTAQTAGSGLQSSLTVFNSTGQAVALNAQQGGDPNLTFQAPANGTYYVGVSSAGNTGYDPTAGTNVSTGTTTGLYTLNATITSNVTLAPDLTGQSFSVGTDTATLGSNVSLNFTIGNQGGAAAAASTVNVELSNTNLFDPASTVVLQNLSLPSLSAGQSYSSGNITVTLPDAATAAANNVSTSGPLYLGTQIIPTDPVPQLDPNSQVAAHQGLDWQQIQIVTPVTASGTNLSSATADALANLNSQVSGTLGASQTNWYQVTVPTNDTGNLTASVTAIPGTSLNAQLTLYGPDGTTPLLQSNAASTTNPDPSLVLNLQPGTYYLAAAGQSGAGGYQLTTTFTPGSSPTLPVAVGGQPINAVVGDFNNDGHLDVAIGNYSATATSPGVTVLLGNGDGTFQTSQTIDLGTGRHYVAVANVTGDGIPDLVVANSNYNPATKTFGPGTVSVLLGNGDGTFQVQPPITVGPDPTAVTVADFNGDGIPDLAVTNANYNPVTKSYGPGSVSILLGNGNGTFTPAPSVSVGLAPGIPAAADLNGDGIPDLVVPYYGAANSTAGNVSVFMGNGNGTFQAPTVFGAGPDPSAVTVADLNGDGVPDLVVTNNAEYGAVTILLGNGNGTFASGGFYPGIAFPSPAQVADVNGDGKLDIVFAYELDDKVGVLLGNGTGSFSAPFAIPSAGVNPNSVVVGDFNGDGRPDLVVADGGTLTVSGPGTPVSTPPPAGTVTVLLGDGDGYFLNQPAFGTGSFPIGVAEGQLTGPTGPADLVIANRDSNTVSVLLGNGDGSFQPAVSYYAGLYPTSVAVADLNGDGRPDIVVTNTYSSTYGGTVSVLLGNGDGTFQPAQSFQAGPDPFSLAVSDVNGDTIPDVVVTNYGQGTVSVLLGYGDGTFHEPLTVNNVGSNPYSVAVADFNGDGIPDMAVTNTNYNPATYSFGPGTVSILTGNNDGTGHGTGNFTLASTLTVGYDPTGLVAAPLVTGNKNYDLAVTNTGDNTVSVLLGNGNGTFQPQQSYPVGKLPINVVEADFNGSPGLAVGNAGGGTVSVLLGNGNGTFTSWQTISDNSIFLTGMVTTTFNGVPGLAVVDGDSDVVNVFLGNGDGTFTPFAAANAVAPTNTPYLMDFNGLGTPASVILDGNGDITFRAEVPGTNGLFESPITLIPDQPAQALTVVQTGPTTYAFAAAEGNSVAVYTVTADNTPVLSSTFTTNQMPTQITAGDFNGDGLGDLVLANGLDNSVTVALQASAGHFGSTQTFAVSGTPSAIAITNAGDIVVTDQASGTVTLLPNQTALGADSATFAPAQVYSATTEPLSTGTTVGAALGSGDLLVNLATGNFTGGGLSDLAILDTNADTISVLPADSSGGFVNPQAALAFSADQNSTLTFPQGAMVAGNFNQSNSNLTDLAVLMRAQGEDQVWIYLNQGNGTFSLAPPIAVSSQSDGLNVVQGSAPGLFNILVGDPQGNIVTLVGQGNGTFLPQPSFTGNKVPLAVEAGLVQGGQPAVIVGNQMNSNVSIQSALPGSTQFTAVVDGSLNPSNNVTQLAPGAVDWAALNPNNRSFPYAVVVSSGSDDIQVYPTTGPAGNQTIGAPATYFTGATPVSVTIQEINGDGVPDMLVTNEGSNTVTVLFGSLNAYGTWVGNTGPTLNTHGSGPVGTTVLGNVPGNPNPDLVVTNAGSNTLTILPGVGQGFFNDQASAVTTISLGTLIAQQAPLQVGSSGQELVMPTTAGGLVGVNLSDLSAPVVQTVLLPPPPGQGVAALATLPDGSLVAALQNGTVEQFAFDPTTGTLGAGEQLTPLTGTPADPAALAVLSTPTGTEVLVTSAGEDQLFVFGLASSGGGGSSPGTPGGPPAGPPENPGPPPPIPSLPAPPPLEPPPPGPPVAVSQPSPEAPLVLVVTLQADNPTEGQTELPAAEAEAVPPPGPVAAEQNAPAPGGVFRDGDADEAAQAVDVALAGEDVVPHVDDALRGLNLQPWIDDDVPDGPMSLLQVPGLQNDGGQVFVHLFPLTTDVRAGASGGIDALLTAQLDQAPAPSQPPPEEVSTLLASDEALRWLDEGLTWRTLFPGPAQDTSQPVKRTPADQQATAPDLGLEAVRSLAPDLRAGQGLRAAEPCDWCQASLVALAANGVSWWTKEIASRVKQQVEDHGDFSYPGRTG